MADTASLRPFGNEFVVLDGLSQYRSVASSPDINFATKQDFTVLLRVKPDLVQPRPAFDDVEIVVKWGWQDGYPYAIRYMARGPQAGAVGICRFDGKNCPAVWPATKINDGKLHHLAFVRRTVGSGGVIELYLDGALAGSTADTTVASTQNTAPLYVGCRGKPDGNKTSFFAGQLRDLELTPRALSPAEVAARAADTGRAKPNILIIVADDLGVDAMQINDKTGQVTVHLEDAAGPRPQRLPTFERMVKHGFHFGHTWAQPVCAPSRATLFTGMSPWRTTIGYAAGNNTLPQKQAGTGAPIRSLAEILTAANYRCGIFGKWHLGEPAAGQKRTPVDWGWSRFEGITGGGLGPVTAEYAFPASQLSFQLGDLSKPEIDPDAGGGSADDILRLRKQTQALCREYLIANCPEYVDSQPDIRYYVWKKDLEDKDAGIRKYQCPPSERTHLYATRDQVYGAKDWMKQNFGRPWCVTLTLTLPHDPFHVPPRESYTTEFRDRAKPTRQEMFAAMVQAMDFYLGRLFDSPEVEVRDALKNTVIFFIGDNGTQDDDPDDRAGDEYPDGHLPGGFEFSAQDKGSLIDDDLMDKGTHYIGGVHVPMLIVDGGALLGGAPCYLSAQGGLTGATTHPVHIADIFRTCLEIAGGEVPGDTESVSLLPYLQGQRAPLRNFVFSQQFAPGKKVFGDIPKFGSISDGTFKLSCVRLQFVDGAAQDSYEYELFRLAPSSDPDKVGTLTETRLVNFQCNPIYLAAAQRLHAQLTGYALDGGAANAPALGFPPLPTDPARVDVYLLGSTASGMDAWIGQLRQDWSTMLGRLKAEAAVDLAGAVASYRDVVDGDSLFVIQAKPTASFAGVQQALDGWRPAPTNDAPEGQLFGLYQLGEMLGTDHCGWRRGTQRIVCWVGDRPGHDPLHVPILSSSTGAQLGQFDVEETMVLARLQAAGVTVLPIKLGPGASLDASGQATRIAARTGGEVVSCATPDQLAGVAYAALKKLISQALAAPA